MACRVQTLPVEGEPPRRDERKAWETAATMPRTHDSGIERILHPFEQAPGRRSVGKTLGRRDGWIAAANRERMMIKGRGTFGRGTRVRVACHGMRCLWVVAFLAAASWADEPKSDLARTVQDEPPDVMTILRKADAATRAVGTVSYEGEYAGLGEMGKKSPSVRGRIVAAPGKKSLLGLLIGRSDGTDRIYCEGEIVTPDSTETIPFKIATDGRRAYRVCTSEQSYSLGDLPGASKLINPAIMLYMREFLHPTPFSDEINAKDQRYESAREVGGVDCHVIYIVYANDTLSRWYFGKEDYLPRRVDRILKSGEQEQEIGYSLEVHDLKINPVVDNHLFELNAPEGFTKKPFEKTEKGDDQPLLAIGEQAPDWEIDAPDGRKVSLRSLRGNVVVLEFWATWGEPSKLAMPGVQRLHERFKDRPVKVFGVNCWESGDPVAYMKEKNLTYGLLLKADKVADRYNVTGIPTFYVIGPDGRVVYAASGYEPDMEEKIGKIIQDVLARRASGASPG